METPTLAHNVVHFVRLLCGAGLAMSPAHSVDALEALHWIDITRLADALAARAAALKPANQQPDNVNISTRASRSAHRSA